MVPRRGQVLMYPVFKEVKLFIRPFRRLTFLYGVHTGLRWKKSVNCLWIFPVLPPCVMVVPNWLARKLEVAGLPRSQSRFAGGTS